MTPRTDDPRTPHQIKLHFDSIVASANKAPLQPEPENEVSLLPIILFVVLTLAGVLAALAFIVQRIPGAGG